MIVEYPIFVIRCHSQMVWSNIVFCPSDITLSNVLDKCCLDQIWYEDGWELDNSIQQVGQL